MLLSYCMGFGLFLTAVGGWASGKWQGWTLGGAAATVVVLFLLLKTFGSGPPDVREPKITLKISGGQLFKNFSALEVFEDSGERMFVALNRRLHNASVLIEKKNVEGDCIAFSFTRIADRDDDQGQTEPLDVKMHSGYFREKFQEAETEKVLNSRLHFFLHAVTGSFFHERPPVSDADKPISGLGRCADFGVRSAKLPEPPFEFGLVSTANAQSAGDPDLVEALISTDAQTRRDAREQLAKREPNVLKAVFDAIPDLSDKNFYRRSLGAVVVLTKMRQNGVPAERMQPFLEDRHVRLISNLANHPDKTMRQWATSAVVSLSDSRAIEPLVASLEGAESLIAGKFNAALALRELYLQLDDEGRSRVAAELETVPTTLGPKTRALVEDIRQIQQAAKADGWVYLGTRYGKGNSDWYFSWADDTAALPSTGQTITATGNVHVREDHIRFDLASGWQNADAVGLVAKNDTVRVREVKEVAFGHYWARIEKMNRRQ